MRYMTDGRTTPLMRLSLGLTLLMLIGFWVATGVLFFTRMDLTPASVARYYLGSEADYALPRTYGSMLEVTHAHLAMMAVVLLLLTHLGIFLPWPARARATLIGATFGCALLDEGAGWLVRFVSADLAVLKIGGFVGLELCLLALFAGLAGWIVRRPRARAAARPAARGAAPAAALSADGPAAASRARR